MRVLSVPHCEENRRRLAQAVLGQVDPVDVDAGYRTAVTTLRRFPVASGGITVAFGDSEIAAFAYRQGIFPELVDDEQPAPQDEEHLRRLYSDAVELLAETSPELLRLFELITTEVVFAPSTRIGGGSGSHLPGLIGVSADPAWKALDLAECLVHEATHLNTFLCDMLHGMYTEPASALERDECRVLSAVKVGERRPLDKGLHSALVAVPLMYLEYLLGRSTIERKFGESLLDCSREVGERLRFFTPYGAAVVRDLAEFVETLDYSGVGNSLRMSDEDALSVVSVAA